MTLTDLGEKVYTKALTYLNEIEEEPSGFPMSIVDFVIEYAVNESHFPDSFTEDRIATRLDRCSSALAMACVEVYGRAGSEGERAHSENSISRTYDGAWISTRLHDVLPNYVGII